MTSFTNSSPSLRQTLRYAEWGLLLMMTLLYAIEQFFYEGTFIPDSFVKAIFFNTIFFALSFIFPIDHPLWQRRTYIALEVLLVILAQFVWIELRIPLYFVLIKSCFLLSRREVLFTVAIAGVGYLFSVAWTMPLITQWFTEAIRTSRWDELYKPQAQILGTLIEYVGISLFVILLGFVIVAERKSRQRAEALTQEVETLAAALERSRIARDIHDSLGHTLTTLNIQLELAQEMRQRNPDHATQALSNARLLAGQCLEDIRRAVQTVRQRDFDLTEALDTLIKQVKQNQSLAIHSKISLPPLALPTSHQIYCILQEGLTNIQKHAQASYVSLRSQVIGNNIILELEDNGRGFDPTLTYQGYGLKGMYERVHMLGGKLQIQSSAGKGTQIQVSIPL
jgi:signal transduction histidine kinase